jgi:hypothetical protein
VQSSNVHAPVAACDELRHSGCGQANRAATDASQKCSTAGKSHERLGRWDQQWPSPFRHRS